MTDPTAITIPDWAGPVVVVLGGLVVILGVLIVVADKVRALLGPLGRWIAERQQRLDARALGRLKTRGELEDARVADTRVELQYLRDEIATVRADRAADQVRHRQERADDSERHAAEVAALRREIADLRSTITP